MKHDGNDLIRRKDCIEAIEGITSSMSVCVNTDECHGMKRMQRQAVLEIANMPAVQPDHNADAGKKVSISCGRENDLISRRDAIDTINALHDKPNAWLDCAVDAVMSLPSAQPETHWIPCSNRMPDNLAEVNVTYVNHNPAPYYAFAKDKPFTASAVYYEGHWYWYSSTCADYLGEYGRNDVDKVDDAIEITAWMPLPEPYREEGEG